MATARHQRVAARHMNSRILVRAKNDRRHLSPDGLPRRHLFDDRRMIRSEIAKQILDADLVEAFEKIISGAVASVVRDSFRHKLCFHVHALEAGSDILD